jgi:polyferredoxin
MVTDDKIINTALIRYRLGIVLIWLGVMTWLPFIVLRIAGEKPSLFWYLPFHLFGVVGGSRLRSLARKEIGVPAPKKKILRVIGHGLIYIGILVWAPYFYLKLITQQPVDVMYYLPFHLAGVLGGVLCIVLSYVFSRRE